MKIPDEGNESFLCKMYTVKEMKKILTSTCLFIAGSLLTCAGAQSPLSGTPMGSRSVDYATGQPTETVNQPADAFDGNLATYYASYDRSLTWVGLDLGEPHVITRVGWSPRNDGLGPGRMKLGVFEGANNADFSDALPLYIIDEAGTIGKMDYADVSCSRGFRYVRYVGPSDARCNIAEAEFYGAPGVGDDSRLAQLTNLPTVVINTENQIEPFDKETDIVSLVTIISDEGTTVLTAPATTRQRGNASRQFPKKPYRIKFDKKQRVLGSPAKAKKWTLINNYGDKTLMRNIVAFEMSRRLGMKYTPFCQPVDVVMNGEYKGCYQLCDQLELADGRIEGAEMEITDVDGDALTGAYHIEIDGYAEEEVSWFKSARLGVPVTIKSPDEDDIVPAQSAYIKSAFDRMERELFSNSTLTDPENGYRQYLDIDSWVRHFLIEELAGNPDALWSIHMVKPRGDDRLYVASVWDFDIAFDNDNRWLVKDDGTFRFRRCSEARGMKQLMERVLFSDPFTRGDTKRIWSIARNDHGITAESLKQFVDDTALKLEQSQRLNFMRWPILNQYVHMNPRALGSYAAEVDFIKQYLDTRVPLLDLLVGYDPAMTSVEDIEACDGGQISVCGNTVAMSGFAPGTRYSVTAVSGMEVASGECDGRPVSLSPGIYIVKAGDVVRKIALP